MNNNDHVTMADDIQFQETGNNTNNNTENLSEAFKQCTDELFKVTAEYENFKRHIEADFANYKRRVEKERLEWATSAQSSLLVSFLPFVDDLDRALQTSDENKALLEHPEFKVWISGFNLIAKNLHKSLETLGVKEIECHGDFNPELHEALVQVDSEKHTSGQIVQVFSSGYTFKGQVLRHARVSVAK